MSSRRPRPLVVLPALLAVADPFGDWLDRLLVHHGTGWCTAE